MFCSSCGKKNKEDAVFCIECGRKISSIQVKTVEPITKKKNLSTIWRRLLKVTLSFLLLIVVLSILDFAYQWYKDLPAPVDTLGKISLGMEPVEVTLSIGKPTREDVDGKNRQRYFYNDYAGDSEYVISFDKTSGVQVICTENYIHSVVGLSVYDSERSIIDKLGDPTKTSINKDGLTKFISYNQYKLAFGIKEGSVAAVCVTGTGEVTFINEYQ